MIYTEPVLFPITVDELKILRMCGKYDIKDADVLVNFNYQYTHYRLLSDYVDPQLQQECLEKMNRLTDIEGNISTNLLLFINVMSSYLSKNVYKDYYLLFLCRFINKYKDVDNFTDNFKKWLNKPHDYTYKMQSNPRIVFNLERYYNTIIIPELWKDETIGHLFNIAHDYPSNYFNQRHVIIDAEKHLLEGGKIYILNKKDYSKIFLSLDEEYDDIGKKNENILQKKTTIKKEIPIPEREWL